MQSIEELCQVQVLGGNIIRPKVSYLPSEHQTYTVEGKKVAGASTIAGRDPDGRDQLMNWATRLAFKGICPEAFKRHTANIGTMAHKMIELELEGNDEQESDDLLENRYLDSEFYDEYYYYSKNCFRKFLAWKDDHPSFEPIFTERVFVDQAYLYGGQIDIYGKMGGKKILVDIKSSSSIHKAHLLQVGGGYDNLLVANDLEVDETYILQLTRDDRPYNFERVGAVIHLFSMFETLLDGIRTHKEWISYKKTKVYKEDQSLHDAWIENLRRA